MQESVTAGSQDIGCEATQPLILGRWFSSTLARQNKLALTTSMRSSRACIRTKHRSSTHRPRSSTREIQERNDRDRESHPQKIDTCTIVPHTRKTPPRITRPRYLLSSQSSPLSIILLRRVHPIRAPVPTARVPQITRPGRRRWRTQRRLLRCKHTAARRASPIRSCRPRRRRWREVCVQIRRVGRG